MSVNTDITDRTWQLHLGGLIAIIIQAPPKTHIFENGASSLPKAWRIFQSDAELLQTITTYENDKLAQIFFIMDVVKYRLWKLSLEVEDLLDSSKAYTRKIDVQKARVSVKKIQKNIALFPLVCPRLEVKKANDDMDSQVKVRSEVPRRECSK